MSQIKITNCEIEGLFIIEPVVHADQRGYFSETYNQRDLKEAGIDYVFVQDNENYSFKGVLRGLHFQKLHPQTKLARVIEGSVFDVAVDLRKNSTTYGKWHGEVLTGDNHKQFLIPEGFAHGLLVLSNVARFAYKCTDFWHPNDEGGVVWNDSEIGIEWPDVLKECTSSTKVANYKMKDGTPLIISEKDQKWARLRDIPR